ncbi:DEAD/DEAH box helicase [Trueperella pyogenes]|uniref:DEAD/DEAH box helicase n=1 Tax=Trueperella pyogenes TaxID=1661 RepID=UPI0032487D1D
MNLYGLGDFVDPGSLARGLIYATQEASYIDEHEPGYIAAETGGSHGEVYYQQISYVWDGAFTYFSGECSCPVGYNCKHCVSATLLALDFVPRDLTTASQISHNSSKWRKDLSDLMRIQGEGSEPIALGLTYLAPRAIISGIPAWKQNGTARLEICAMRKGKRDNWIKTGISLSTLRNGAGDETYDPAQLKAVREFVTACDMVPFTNTVHRETLYLTWNQSSMIAEYLKKCLAAGVVLLDATTKKPVIVDPDPAVPVVSLMQTDTSLKIVADLEHPRITPEFLMVGQPKQLVVWDDAALCLAFIEPFPSKEWGFLKDREVDVPTQDLAEFERDFLPALKNRDIRTRNYEPPPEPTPHLCLTLISSGETVPIVDAIWEWVYADRDRRDTYSLHSPMRGWRDYDLEEEILADVVPVVEELCPQMVDGRLLERTTVMGKNVLSLGELTAALRERAVEVIDETPGYRRASEIQVDVDVAESRDWLDLRMKVVVDGQQVELHEVLYPLIAGAEYIFIGGSYLDLKSPDLDKLRGLIKEARLLDDQRRTSLRVPKIRASWWQELLDLGIVHTVHNNWLATVRNITEPEPAAVPTTLNATLRAYQEEGFAWLSQLRDAGLGGVLADDMGLGKTIQVLSMILRDRERNPGSPWLVVAPTSVVSNWVAEAARFAPSLKVVGVDKTQRIRGQSLAEEVAGADVVVTSYTLLRLEADDYRELCVTGLVLDEAQNVKNPRSKGFAVAASLGAPTVFAVTGTPIENNLGELWAMFALAAPGLLGMPDKFNDAFRKPIEKAAASRADNPQARELMARLRRRIRPFLLRRTKESVQLDLPPKQEQILRVELKGAHKRMYEVQLEKERQRVLGLEDEDRIEILSALTRLRQLAIDPRLSNEDSSAPRSKMDELMPLLDNLVAEGHSALVFSQFTRFLKMVAAQLGAAGIPYLYLDGATTGRAKLIERFTRGEAPVLLISLKAGGTGLNLTMADYAIVTDPWWNPAAEEQAVDRAHRIGQTRPVHVYRLVSAGTIEEKVVALQEQKRRLLGVISDDAAVASTKLSAAELRALLS